MVPSRKRPSSSFVSPFPSKKNVPSSSSSSSSQTLIDKMVIVLADAGCTLSSPPSLPSDLHRFRLHLHRLFSANSSLRSDFLSAFSSYINSSSVNLHRILMPSSCEGSCATRDSLARSLVLVPSIQLELLELLLEKLPEYFDVSDADIARLILNQFRWLDFLVDSEAFSDKLLQVLSICPLQLKKEIIGSLPEIIGDRNNKNIVDCLQQLLQEDSAVIVPVLDSFSNLSLNDQLQEQVITIALPYIRTIDAEYMPYLLRFLLLSATSTNARWIIARIREQLKFVGLSNPLAKGSNKNKGKSVVANTEASILDALKSCLRFKTMLCQEILKELKSLENARDHKVIDFWLLILTYTNSEALEKSVEKIFKRKIIDGCITAVMFDQCIQSNKELVKDYFPSFLSLAEYLFASKEEKAREFSSHMYISLFKEFADMYSRREVLGALATHVGSGVGFEVGSGLDTMILLASECSQELLSLSYHINGILDYLEEFSIENLHKVYQVFSSLALSARSTADSCGSSIANELLMIVRKQLSNPDLKYKKMGLIGTLKIVSCLGDAHNNICPSQSQKSNCVEALELLRMSLDSCKHLPMALILLYDELTTIVEFRTLEPAIMNWVGKHIGEFESRFLADLDGGRLPTNDSYCDLEGTLWMNLDGDISPICLNILPLLSSATQSASLQILPANFLLLSTIERLANKGSLGGIDALLGCPLHLPSPKYFSRATTMSLSEKQKQILCHSLYFAINWIRELLNAFCTQIVERSECTSQAAKEEIIAKLLRRIQNLVFLESLLNDFLKHHPVSLPELCPCVELYHMERKMNERRKVQGSTLSKKRGKQGGIIEASSNSNINDKLKQPTIVDVLRKAGAITSQAQPNDSSSCLSSMRKAPGSQVHYTGDSSEPMVLETCSVAKILEEQRFKFRPLLLDCYSILTHAKCQESCCPDPVAELPLHLYLVRDLHYKLKYFSPPSKQFSASNFVAPPCLRTMTMKEFLLGTKTFFPSLKKYLDVAANILKDSDNFQEHWEVQSASSANEDIAELVISKASVSKAVFQEVLQCFSLIINFPGIYSETVVLVDLLKAFQPPKVLDSLFSGLEPIPLPGKVDYLYAGAYSFLEGVFDIACSMSFLLASEVLVTLEAVLSSVQKFLDQSGRNSKTMSIGINKGILLILHRRLKASAEKLLRHNFDNLRFESDWKSKGDTLQKILHIFLENSDSTSILLNELACSVLPKVSPCKGLDDACPGFPTLQSRTFVVWYRVLHEENLAILNKVVKEVFMMDKLRTGVRVADKETLLTRLKHSVNVIVSLVNLCRIHDKVTVHTMAVKYGGKFVDSFLKVFPFLQSQFTTHSQPIIQTVKELQKATRTLQTLCSEAKGLKQMAITRSIPATKRSLERFLFQVKALLHATSSECTFWMGNLKHKDLMGQVVSSQAYAEDQNNPVEDNSSEAAIEDQPVSVANDEGRESS